MPPVRKTLSWVVASVAVIAGAATSPPGVTPLLARQLSEAAAARTTIVELKRLHDAGAVIILDVRGAGAYRQGHIPGAILVPLETAGAWAAELKAATKPIVTYCS